MADEASPTPSRAVALLRRFGPILAILAALALVFATGLHERVSLAWLSENYAQLTDWVGAHPFLAGGLFVLFYAAAVTISLPGALWFTISGGLLFGWFWGGVLSWAGATVGATLVFLAARTALKDTLRAKAGSRLDQFKRGFEKNAFLTLVTLRIIPLPFFLVNVAPAFFNVRVATFFTATALGIIPGTFAYATLGAGAGDAVKAGRFEPSILAEPKLLIAFGALGLLAIAPALVRRLMRRRGLVQADGE